MTNKVKAARNVVSMGDVTGPSGSYTFWERFSNVDLFYGLDGKCFNCSDDATLFKPKTNTGFYDVVGTGKHVHDLLNIEEKNQHFCMVWTKDLELVHSGRKNCKVLSAAILHGLSPFVFIVALFTLLISF